MVCGDMSSNPGPERTKISPKYPCGECQKASSNNQDVILCANCNNWSHAKCLQMSRHFFQYYVDRPDIEWTCPTCALPSLSDSLSLRGFRKENLPKSMY